MTPAENNLVTVDELSKLFLLSKGTINYYTNMGLLNVAVTKGNKRLYNKEEVRTRIEKIRQMRNSGYSLRLIREYFSKNLEGNSLF